MPAARRAGSVMYSAGRKRRIATGLLSRSVSTTTTTGHGWLNAASLRTVAVIVNAPAVLGSGRTSRESSSSFAVSRISGSWQGILRQTRATHGCVAGSRNNSTRFAHASCAASSKASSTHPSVHIALAREKWRRGRTYTGKGAAVASVSASAGTTSIDVSAGDASPAPASAEPSATSSSSGEGASNSALASPDAKSSGPSKSSASGSGSRGISSPVSAGGAGPDVSPASSTGVPRASSAAALSRVSSGSSTIHVSLSVSGAGTSGAVAEVLSSDSMSANQSSALAPVAVVDCGAASSVGADAAAGFLERDFLAARSMVDGGTASVRVGAHSPGSCSGSGLSGSIGNVSESVRSASNRLSQRPQRTMPSEACNASSSIS